MKSKGTAYLLWIVGLFGILGLHHFYLGKPIKGLIWLFTGGVFGLGALIDLFTLGSQVEGQNTKEELKTIRAKALSLGRNASFVAASLTFFASCQKADATINECQQNAQEMLLPVAYQEGNEVETCFAIGAFQLFRTLTMPVTIADMKAALEQDLSTVFTQDSFDIVLGTISSLPWDSASLTTADISLINEIRDHLNPNPVFTACGGTLAPSQINDVTIVQQPFLGDPNFRHAFKVVLNGTFTCQVHDVYVVNIITLGNNVATPPTFTCDSISVENGNRVFGFYQNEWLNDPSLNATSYTTDLQFRDSSGNVLSTIPNVAYSF